MTVCCCARPWVIAMRFSYLVSVHRAGRPSRLATQATTACSGSAPNFAPNAPPTSGVITRIWSCPMPSSPARLLRVPCAPWFGIHAVSRPSSPQAAAPARTSIGAGATRWFMIVCRTTASHSSNRCSSSAAGSPKLAAILVPASSNKITSSDAAAARLTTAGSGS